MPSLENRRVIIRLEGLDYFPRRPPAGEVSASKVVQRFSAPLARTSARAAADVIRATEIYLKPET